MNLAAAPRDALLDEHNKALKELADAGFDVLSHFVRNARIGQIYEGANEVQLWSIARIALGRDVTG